MKKIIGFIILLSFLGCKSKDSRFDVPGKPTHLISINRFDQTFYTTGGSTDSVFLDLYANDIMKVGEPGSALFNQFDSIFRTDKEVKQIYNDCQRIFKDVTPIETKLTRAFHRLHYFFPDIPYPKVYMHISGFGASVITAENILSASIDKYLGTSYNFYPALYDPYQIQRMYPEKIVSDYMAGWIRSEFTEESLLDQQRLLDYMIYEGKMLYFLKVLLPEEKMEDLCGFTKEQLSWCTLNEPKIWQSILKLQHLYCTDQLVIAKYIVDAPYTSFFPKDSPGRAVIWTGYRIVEAYMKKNKEITIKDLLLNKKAQDIQAGSIYHP
jgi:hypothetical protein